MKTRNYLAIALMLVGSLQMIGYLTKSKITRGIGLASGVAPFPKVFCEANGYEAFAARFTLEGETDAGPWSQQITPEVYSQLRGPYNRRNVYGAALAFAPRLEKPLREQLFCHALAPGSAMRKELCIPPEVKNLRVIVAPREGEKEGPWTFQIP